MHRVITRVEAGNGSSSAAGLTSWERERAPDRSSPLPLKSQALQKGCMSGGGGLYTSRPPHIIDLSASCQLLHAEIAILASSAYKRLKKLKRGWNTLVDFNQDVSLLQTALCN